MTKEDENSASDTTVTLKLTPYKLLTVIALLTEIDSFSMPRLQQYSDVDAKEFQRLIESEWNDMEEKEKNELLNLAKHAIKLLKTMELGS